VLFHTLGRKYIYYYSSFGVWFLGWKGGCYFMNLRAWTWVGEHEQRSRTESFYNILPTWIRYLKNILSNLRHNIWWHGKIFFHMSWMNDIYGWKCGLKWRWMNFFMNIRNKFCFAKNWTKETGYKKFMLVYCEQFVTWNVQIILEQIFHILAL